MHAPDVGRTRTERGRCIVKAPAKSGHDHPLGAGLAEGNERGQRAGAADEETNRSGEQRMPCVLTRRRLLVAWAIPSVGLVEVRRGTESGGQRSGNDRVGIRRRGRGLLMGRL